MKLVAIGAHLERDDVGPLAEAVPVRDLFLSALAVPDDQPLGDRELLLRVASVRADLVERATFLAIRYGFAATSAADAESRVAAHLDRWRRILREHRGEVEMTLKVAAATPHARPDRRDFSNGAEYLRALHAATRAAAVDEGFRADVEGALVPLATRHRWQPRDGASVECAMLVARDGIEAFVDAGAQLKERHPDVPFLLSGPWPLEVFADDHE